ncbi:ribosome biogenesis regulatory protein homolog [Paramacrobiotus metropolitanus]|uniref:ribosome biogenesis regulatory protein homolog n=1 Tax=Paramacrobiotus metropolitanus TaxID=2943436 RepID=UPI002445F7CB|nr:ribosome biogenesis regulatory protein homolog [Paramacrobiotus metropolitanus]
MAKSAVNAEELGVEIDIGNLLLSDPRPLAPVSDGESTDAVIEREMAKLSQMLVERIWGLPLERLEDAIVAALPAPTTILPREKPIPKAKAVTKWERYAREKGIKKTKKSRMVYDEATKEWKPRWGYKRAKNPDGDWVVEVPDQADGMNDPFEERQTAKKERVAKNELQRLKNIARAHKTKIPAGGILPATEGRSISKDEIGHAASFARSATASAGVFTETLRKEKPPKNTGKKRKFESNFGDGQTEKNRMIGILDGISSKKPRMDVETAVKRVERRSQKPKRDSRPHNEDEGRPSGGRFGGKSQRGGKFGPSRGGFSQSRGGHSRSRGGHSGGDRRPKGKESGFNKRGKGPRR